MELLNDDLKLSDIVGEGIYQGKDYQDENGHWVLIYDVEFWERTGRQENTSPVFAHVDMLKDGWIPDQDTLYKAREHWVTTTESFRVMTPKEEHEKIKQRQKEIYWEIVNEFLECFKTEFLTGLKNAPDEKGFWESELEDWRNYKFSREVVKGWREFNKIIPRCVEEIFPMVKGINTNHQPKEEARYRFFKWLEKYRLSNDAIPPVAASTDENKEAEKKLTHSQIALLYIYTYKLITRNNAQEIAEKYGQSSGQKLTEKYNKMYANLTERTSSKVAVKDIERVISLLSDPKHLKRAKDELKQAKTLKSTD